MGTSRNPALVAPIGTKNNNKNNNYRGLGGLNLGASSSLGASIEDISAATASMNLNRTLGAPNNHGGPVNRYF